MNFPSLLRPLLMRVLAICLVVATPQLLQADLVWTPEKGWDMDGGVLDSIADPAEVQNAVSTMNRARAEQEIKNYGSALKRYKEVIKDYSTSVLAPEAHFQSALIRADRLQWTKAFKHLQKIVEQYPSFPKYSEVIREQYEIAEKLREGARLRLFWIFPGFRSPERAVEYYEKVVENAPYSEVAPDALLHAAEVQIKRGKTDEGVDLFDRMISEYPRNERIPEAYFGLANVFSTRVKGPAYDQGATREAMIYFEDFAILHPKHPRAGEAAEEVNDMRDMLAQSRIVIGDFYYRYRSNYYAARVFYNEAITLSPKSESAEEARNKLAKVDLAEEARKQ